MNKIITFLKNNYIFFSLFFIVILGAVLRFKGLVFNDYWLDELYSADFSDPSRSFDNMVKITLEDVHPPVYQTLLWIWHKIFGFTEYAGRSLSAVIGIFSIIAIYFLGRELFNKQIGLYAALIVSTNIFLIQYSQEVRSYILFFLLSILSYIFLHRVVNNSNKINIVLYWCTTIVLFYTHYFSFFIVATQLVFIVIYIMIFTKDKKKLFMLSLWTSGVFIVSLAPLVPYILLTMEGTALSWIKTPSVFYFINYIVGYFGSKVSLVVIYLGMAIGISHLLTVKLSKKEKISLILLFIWVSFGYFLPYLKSILSSPVLMSRLTIAMIPPIILITSYGLWKIKGWKGYLILAFYFLFSLKFLFSNYYGHVTKDQYREVLQEIVKYKPVPVYERIPFNGHQGNITNHYQTYAKMLKLDMNIQNDIDLKKDIKEKNLPECFWVLNAHFFLSNKAIEKSKIIKNNSIHIVKKIKHRRAEGILLSYDIEPRICAERVGVVNK